MLLTPSAHKVAEKEEQEQQMEARGLNGSVREGGVVEDYLTQKGSFTGSLQLSQLWWWSQYEGLLSSSFHYNL